MKLAMKVACLPVFLFSVLVPSFSQAQTKIRLAYSSITGNQAPLWIAWDRGLFKKNGLDVEMIFIEGGSRVVQAMVAGDTPIAHVGATPIATGNLRGADLVMYAATVNKILFQFFVAKEITRREDLKGKKFGISRFGSGSDFALRAALKALGLDPRKDVAILQLGTTPVRMAALDSGAIQGTVLLPPETILARKKDYRLLGDLAASEFEFLNMGVAASRTFADAHPETMQSFIRSYIEGIHFFKTRPTESMKLVGRYTRTEDREVLQEIFDLYQKVFLMKPYVTVKGIQNILDDLAQTDAKRKGYRPQSMMDNSYLKQLDDGGFIDRLYQ